MVRLFKQKLSQVFGCFPLDCSPRLAFFPTRLRPYCPLAFSRLIDSYKKEKKKKKQRKKEKKLTASSRVSHYVLFLAKNSVQIR